MKLTSQLELGRVGGEKRSGSARRQKITNGEVGAEEEKEKRVRLLVFLAPSKFIVLFFMTMSTNVSTEITRMISITTA